MIGIVGDSGIRIATTSTSSLGRMHFARHLRQQRLGEFTIGTQLHRSDSLALVQLLILYRVVTARAVVALGAASARPFADAALTES